MAIGIIIIGATNHHPKRKFHGPIKDVSYGPSLTILHFFTTNHDYLTISGPQVPLYMGEDSTRIVLLRLVLSISYLYVYEHHNHH